MKFWQGLLFHHGYIADPALARALAAATEAEAAATPRATARARRRRPPLLARLVHGFVFLGGRPMHAGHNFDVEEPFDPPPAPPRLRRTDAEACRHA